MDKFDTKKIYCRKLGHELHFEYCRQEQDSLPCFKVINCWYEHFDVNTYLEKHFTETERTKMLQPPQSRMLSIIDMIEKAKNNHQN